MGRSSVQSWGRWIAGCEECWAGVAAVSALTAWAMKSVPEGRRRSEKGKSHFVILKSEFGEHMELRTVSFLCLYYSNTI